MVSIVKRHCSQCPGGCGLGDFSISDLGANYAVILNNQDMIPHGLLIDILVQKCFRLYEYIKKIWFSQIHVEFLR